MRYNKGMRTMILSLSILLFVGCSMPNLSTFGMPEFETPEEAMAWVYENVTYVSDIYDQWQTPDETLSLMAGDCEDMAGLLAYLFDGEVIGIQYGDSNSGHAVARIDGIYYDATLNKSSENIPGGGDIIKEMSIDAYLFWARVR